MLFGDNLTAYALIAMIGIAVGGVIFAIIYPWLFSSASASRIKSVAGPKKENSGRSKLLEEVKDNRRKQVQESLNKIGENAKKKKRLSLKVRINQAGLEITSRTFYLISIVVGVVLALAALIAGAPLFTVPLIAFAGAFGVPRWVLNYLGRRRQNKFLNDFADAIDVMVRGLKSGLPVTEAMRIISTEQGPPVGPEFMEVVEGQKIGIPIDQGIERMVERVPLPEVNFLAIVMTIQSKTGGNLSEALGNLSRVLRDRKKMKAKVQAVSQEAKSSAMIIGGMPFAIMGIMSFSSPGYLLPMFHTHTGNMMLVGCAIWMVAGTLVMKKMINFKM
ncbi:MAG: type II secretion system F family protein [Aestuariivirga sp.]